MSYKRPDFLDFWPIKRGLSRNFGKLTKMGSFGNFSFGGVVVVGGGPIFLAVKNTQKVNFYGDRNCFQGDLKCPNIFLEHVELSKMWVHLGWC